MASLLDSEAQFIQRTLDLKFSDELKKSLKRSKLERFGTYAYAHGQPGQNIVDADFEAWFTGNVMTNASLADIAGAKRLLFESQTMVLAALEDQVKTTDHSVIKKIPVAERETKMKEIKKKLCGLLIEGPMEPAHCLLDAVASMSHHNEVRYVAPERCISRTFEVLNQKSPMKQVDVSAEQLVVKEKAEVPDMSVTSALQVQEAFQRRGIALVFADLIQHNSYTRYLSALFGHLHRDPPPGYSRCTVSQLVSADKLVWQILIEEGVRPKRDEAGVLSLDKRMLEVLESYRVSFSMLPLLAKKDTGNGSPTKKPKPAQPGGKGSPPGVNKPWLKSKGGKKGAKSKQRVPAHIFKLGGTAANPEGEPICFGYNSEGGCADAADGARCRRGLHVCSKCYATHSILKHGA